MFSRLRQMLIKEFLQLFRDKRARFILIGPPIVQMLVFGYAATYEIHHVPVAVLDLDHSQESRDFISRFASSPYFQIREYVGDQRQMADRIDRGEVVLALDIHAGFARKLRGGRTASVQVILDSTNSNTALIALGYARQIAARFAGDYQKDRLGRAAPLIAVEMPGVELDRRPWFNPDLNSRWFFVPGVIGTLTLVLVVTLTAFAVVREREIGTLEQIMVTPIRQSEFILGKTLPFFLVGLADVTLIALVGTYWFRVPFRGNLAVLFLGAVLFLLCTLGIGLFVSTVSATQQQAMISAFFFVMPAVVFSGFAFPLSSVPPGFQKLAMLNPLTHFLVVLRGVYLKGVGLETLWREMAAMAAIGAAMLAVSILRFRKSLD
jgi:drug efflux transport system permease protein